MPPCRITDGGRHVVLRGLDEHRGPRYVVLDRVGRKNPRSKSTLLAEHFERYRGRWESARKKLFELAKSVCHCF